MTDILPARSNPHRSGVNQTLGRPTFTEPNLSFGVGAQSEARVQLLICLSHELAQPPLDVQRPTTSRITIETTPQQTQDAAAALQEYLATFPAR